MYQDLLRDAKFLSLLLHCDRDLAEEVRERGCPKCGGRLHRADYERKPRGGLAQVDPEQAPASASVAATTAAAIA